MTGSVRVEISELSKLAGLLDTTHDQLLAGAGAQAAGAQVGNAKVAEALNEFYTNWDYRRRGLAERLGVLGTLLFKAADMYAEQERMLKQSFDVPMPGAKLAPNGQLQGSSDQSPQGSSGSGLQGGVAGVAQPSPAPPATDSPTRVAGVSSQILSATEAWTDGSPGGQCKQWVNDVLGTVGVRLGGGYYSDFLKAGGHLVSRDEAVPGDIIQLNNPNDRDAGNGQGYYNGMHTAIIRSHVAGTETFDVVDSNYGTDEKVSRHSGYNPYDTARADGLEVNIFHFGPALP
jgi:hypothetical protein